MQKLLAFLKSLFFGPEAVVTVEMKQDENHSQRRVVAVRDNRAKGGQQDKSTYWLVNKDGTTFSGTPAEFGRFEAKRRGVSEVAANRESIIVYLLGEKAKGKVGTRRGWKLQ